MEKKWHRSIGWPGAEKNLIQNCPLEINSFGEIKPLDNKYKNELERERNPFFEKLPNLI
jgi:hypothetical protein